MRAAFSFGDIISLVGALKKKSNLLKGEMKTPEYDEWVAVKYSKFCEGVQEKTPEGWGQGLAPMGRGLKADPAFLLE